MHFANSVKVEASLIARKTVDKTTANYDQFVTGTRA
jgi:hypothetical protein